MKHKWGKTLQNRSFRGPHIHKRWRKKAQKSDLRLFMKVKEEDSIIPPQLLLILWKKAPPQVSTIDLSATKCGHTSSRCIQSSKLIDIFGAFDYIWSLLPTHHGNATSHHNVYVYRYIDIYVFRFFKSELVFPPKWCGRSFQQVQGFPTVGSGGRSSDSVITDLERRTFGEGRNSFNE